MTDHRAAEADLIIKMTRPNVKYCRQKAAENLEIPAKPSAKGSITWKKNKMGVTILSGGPKGCVRPHLEGEEPLPECGMCCWNRQIL